jgi:fructose-1,6-bisphosphatase/inositol monophosphatase family enzyme
MQDTERSKYLEFAKAIANRAGEIMRSYYRSNQQVEMKADDSPVTAADKAINSLLIEEIKKQFPEHGVLGEEESWQSEKETLWVCDPIDGTKAFILQIPVSMFSLALVIDGVPVLAVAYNPFTNELFSAVKNEGAFLNDVAIHVSKRKWGQGTKLAKSDSERAPKHLLGDLSVVDSLKAENVSTNSCPGAVFRGCNVAAGSFDGGVFYGDTAHDIAAVKLIIEEAGGKVTAMNGDEQSYNTAINGAVFTNGLIHEQLVQKLQDYLT